ncbi:hypothetical protein JTB14_006190 [Gonioctena quinquepunctata]|nr:hypothetical protein JTB14_006190 [Gonioctena quinquepunctata]
MVIDNSSHRLSTNSAQTTRTESLTNLNSNPCPRDSSALDPSEISNHCCGSTRFLQIQMIVLLQVLEPETIRIKQERNENISPENNISHLSEDDQDFDSSESDCPSDSTNGRLKNQEKKQPDQVKRYEQPELPRRIEPQHRNYLIIENQDRWRQKRKIPLRRLSLRGYRRVTDVTLNYIANLEIELIDLTYTSVTKQGIENFLVHNPNCRVIHPLYCTCKPKNRFLI